MNDSEHIFNVLNNVNVRLLLGSQLTCWPDQKSHMANCIIFRF